MPSDFNKTNLPVHKMHLYTFVIVEDNEVELMILKMNLLKYNYLKCVNTFTNANDAYSFLCMHPVDIIFSDIQMPNLSGIELHDKLKDLAPCVVYITAFDRHAIDAFGLGAVDYIIKPINKERLDNCIERVKRCLDTKYKSKLFDLSNTENTIQIKQGHDTVNVKLHEIIYLEALKDYTKVITLRKRLVTRCLLGNLLEETVFSKFIRIHKSFAIQPQYIQSISTNKVELINDIVLPLGRAYKQNLKQVY